MDVLRWEATPVEIQQLVSNLCADASSVDHLSGGGGDPWYDGKDLLAILWQEQVQMVKGPKITNDSNNIKNNTAMQTNWETNHFETLTDLQKSCSTAQTCHLLGCPGCCRFFTQRGQRQTGEGLLHIPNVSLCRREPRVNTHAMTVFVDTMYSTSLVQGLTKLNHWLCKVTKEPCFVLNL